MPPDVVNYISFLKNNIHHYYSMEYWIESKDISIPDTPTALLRAESILYYDFHWSLGKIDEFRNAEFKQQCFMFSDTMSYYLRLKSLFESVERNVILFKKHYVFLLMMNGNVSYELRMALNRFCKKENVDLNERMSLSWKKCGF